MASTAALSLVPSTRFFREEVSSWSKNGDGDGHSLHFAISNPDSISADLVGFFIDRYSERGCVVLDPFCGAGTTALESALRGRLAIANDSRPLAARIARAKLFPADITEVTLAMQRINLRRPIDMKLYRDYFAPFYDLETFREIVNLRSFLQQNDDRITRFIELVAMSLLHGHSAGYLSVYTFPQISLTPQEQEALNIKRRQTPDYRAVVPRILRRTASILRDGVPSTLRSGGLIQSTDKDRPYRTHQAIKGDCRNLGAVRTSSVDLVITAPPTPLTLAQDSSRESWLRSWFMSDGAAENVLAQSSLGAIDRREPRNLTEASLEKWSELMNESLLELARVVRPRGRVVFDLPEQRLMGTALGLDDLLLDSVVPALTKYWEADGVYSYGTRAVKLGLGDRSAADGRAGDRGVQPSQSTSTLVSAERSHVLVLKRR